ncbi:Rrf2 family transcriptional regulator [Magnetospirillum sp. UT-4]|uniref:RrF2 family transcriptional regulator n=1 Tax=Magnetospirillum sp. UT-4 TaxID=2681467 RepID=UPI00137CB6FE|nr:Rrf2 family transcriptional regulator [Magnetospirillum sp. UT-4]CAA7620311.1 HTH-type transcriptional regulator NsrR [Magnetospirillum sp. UT-4]
MKITQFTDFSLRMLLYLAANRDRPVTVREVAGFYDISSEHLKKIVRRLSELGHIRTMRGKNGGLRLAREPAEINLGQLVRQAENLSLLPCYEGLPCQVVNCKLRGVVDEGLAAFLAAFDRKTLADII